MPYLVDSDWLIEYQLDVPEARALVERLIESGIAVSMISYMEVYDGLRRSPDFEAAAVKFEAFMNTVLLMDISREVARRCAALRDALRRQGKQVRRRALDLLIAATALEHSLTLVTRNAEDYQDVPGLDLA